MRTGLVGRLVLLCAVTVLPTVQAMAALNAYMTIEGTKQGKIKGESEQIKLTDVVRNESAGRDAATGMATGKRQHGTITIVKMVDRASPMFFQAMHTNEVLSSVVIVFPEGSSKTEKAAQKVSLGDAVITDISKVGNSERITFTYQKIEVTYVNGNKSAQDAWDAK